MSTGNLSATGIKSAKAKDKVYQLSDGGGLALQVNTNGSKWWRFRYRFDNKAKTISMGTYPEISLAEARAKKDKARNQIANGINPSEERKAVKKEQIAVEVAKTRKVEFSFEVLTRGILKRRLDKDDIREGHYHKTVRALENDAFPIMGDIEVKDIKPTHIKKVVRNISKRGANDSARKMYYTISKIFKTIATRSDADEPEYDYQVEISPALSIDVDDLVGKVSVKHYPSMREKKELQKLLTTIDDYTGHYTTKMALKVLPHIFLRSHNIRYAEWNEIDFEERLWRIPGSKMKMGKDFIIPMSIQLIELLEEMYLFSGEGRYVFPSQVHSDSPISNNTMLAALQRMGYTGDIFVPHSWRNIFATIAN